jgi:hypothetical protein
MRTFITIAALITLAACGGGGGGGTAPATASPPAKTTAVLKIGTSGTLPAGVTGLSGVGVTITLPPGVTVATDSSGNVGASVAIVSGVASGGSLAPPVYTPASRTLRLVIAAGATLFGTGEFVTVTCILPAGNTLQTSDFPVTILNNLEPANQLLQPVAGLAATITATLY